MSILFINGDNETDGGSLELDGASFVTSADVGGTTYVFVAGGVDNGISVFSLNRSGVLTNTYNVTDSGSLNLVGVSGLTTITSGGNTYLVAAGTGDNGLSVFRVSTSGQLTSVYDLADSASYYLSGVSRVTSATVGGSPYVFAAGTNEDGISVFKVTPEGTLTWVANIADNGTYELDGVKGLTTAVINGNTFLFAAGSVDDGVSVFQVGSNGSLTHTSSVTDDATYKLDGASEVATAVVGGTTYLFVSGSSDNGVTVFSVSSSGVLSYVTNVGDSASLRLTGAAGLAVSTFGANTYLTVGGTENGVSLFKVNTGGTLTFIDNIDDGGSRALTGTTMLHTASAGGVNYVVAAGSTDDGIGTFGMKSSGQLWFSTTGGGSDTRVVRINSDGSGQSINIDNSAAAIPSTAVGGSTLNVVEVGVDTATGVYFIMLQDMLGQNAQLMRGVIGSSAAPVSISSFATDDIVNVMQVDAIHRKIYVGYQDQSAVDTDSGIIAFSYDSTGAITGSGFIVTAASDTRANEGAYAILNPRDFALDPTVGTQGRLFYTEMMTGTVKTVGLFRLDLSSPTVTTQVVSQAQFPDTGTNGYIYDVEVDQSTDLVYFSTISRTPYDPSTPGATTYVASQNAIWYVSENGSGDTATKLTLNGAVGTYFYPADMTFDQNTRQLYVESQEQQGSSTDNVIYVFQLDAAGSTGTLINTIYPSPTFTSSGATVGGLAFATLVNLGVAGTSSAAAEQNGAATFLLTGSPTITDTDGGYLTGATVQITGGKFSSNESSTADDHLGYGSGQSTSGTVGGITYSWDAATETLTLSGLDSIANYQAMLSQIVYWTTGDNPTNYGLNTNRTITWTVSDGTLDVPAGSVNSTTTTLTISGVNDAPVNGTVTSASGNEASNIAITGLQISDVDANPALQTFTVTLSVTKGVLTLLTNVSGGLTSGNLSGNGTATVTVSGTIDAINATLAATNGLVFLGNANQSGTDTLTVVTSDGGGSGSGGTLSDTDNYTITIANVNDAPTVVNGATVTITATNEDISPTTLSNTISSLFSSHYNDGDGDAFAGVAVVTNGSSGSTGQWQYWNGSTWVDIGSASTSAAVELTASTAIRFAPVTDFNGSAPTLEVRLVDASSGFITNGTIVNTSTSGGSTQFSSSLVTLTHTVTDVNDSPVTINGAAVSLATIAEDSAPGVGETVTSLFTSHFSDVKDGAAANSLAGIAVTADNASAAQGVYQYYDGVTWVDFPAVSTTNALVLDINTRVRFVPAADYNGTPTALTVHMIENSAGAVTTGSITDLTNSGGATPYGTAMTLGITVTGTNDAPVATGTATLSAVNEDASNPGGASVSSLFSGNIGDPDGDGLGGVAITGNAATSQGTWQYNSGSGWTSVGSPTTNSALVLKAADLIRFVPASNYNGSVPGLTAHVIDDSATVTSASGVDVSANGGASHYSSGTVTLSTSITAVNDTPLLAAAGAASATEQTAAVILPTVTVSDTELDALNGGAGDYDGASVVVRRNGGANAVDTFGFDTSGASFTVSGSDLQIGGLTFATFSVVSGTLTISFASTGAVATSALVDDVIQHITYTNTSDAPSSSVNIYYAINDGGSSGAQGTGGDLVASNVVLVNITPVNDAPTGGVTINGTAAEDQVLTAVSTLADPDGIGTLSYAWERFDGSSYTPIGGATASTYTLVDADIGAAIRVKVSYTDAGGTTEDAYSVVTANVTATNDAPTGAVTITGTTTEDQVLTADTSTVADPDGLGPFSYEWQRSANGTTFTAIGATDQATYTLTDADVGKYVRVVITYTDGQGFLNTVDSAGTAQILGVNDPHTGGVSLSGTETENQTLTVSSTLADVDGIGTLHYDWQRGDGTNFTSTGAADQATYILGDADVGQYVRVIVSYTDSQGFSEQETSAHTTNTITGVNDAPTGTVTISGSATEDQVLTAVTSTLADADGLGTLHYSWQRDFNDGNGYVAVSGTDQATYTLGDPDVGAKIRVVVSYTDGQGFSNTVNSGATTSVAPVNDPHTGGVTITGTATEDQVLTAVSTLADIDGLGTLHYDWQRGDGTTFTPIGAADQATYTLGDADVGLKIRVIVSYTDGQGFGETTTTSYTATVGPVNDAPTGGVTINGTTTEDQVLTADTSTLADIDGLGTLHYDWQRGDGTTFTPIGAADQATYTLGDADVGKIIKVVISYTDGQGFSNSVEGASAQITAVNDAPIGGVTITGTQTEDHVLTADTSALVDVDGLGTFSYDWQRDTGSGYVSIGAADQATYTLGDADVGATVQVVISYTDGQGFSEQVTSGATGAIVNVNDVPAGAVNITGTSTEFQTLTASTSSLSDTDGLGTLHYDWQKDSGSGYVSLGAADQATYTLTTADIGGTIQVVITYTDGHGTLETVTSGATATVIPNNGPHTGTVTITGAPTEDQTLTVVSTMADAGGLGTLHYDWQRSTSSGYVSIGAADQATYTLGDADVDKSIRVVVSYTDGQGVFESETSAAVGAVLNVNDAPTGAVTITGTIAEDSVVTADTSTLADLDGLGALHYRWQRQDGSGFSDIGAADQASYTPGDADVGLALRVVVSYIDGHGTAQSVTSGSSVAVANVNDAPVAANDANSVIQRQTTTGTVLTNDSDIDNLTSALVVSSVAFNTTHVGQAVSGSSGTVVQGGYGKLTIFANGTYSYVASQEGILVGQVVTDKFDYTISDPSGATASAQLTVTVTGSATGDANANAIASDANGHVLTGRGGGDILTGGAGADTFNYEAITDSTLLAPDVITDFTHGEDLLKLTPLITGSTKVILSTDDGANKFVYIDQNGDGVAESWIVLLGMGLQVSDIVTGVTDFGFTMNGWSGADTLTGGTGDDTISGFGGDDIIRGGLGKDTLSGGSGADRFVFGVGESSLTRWDVVVDFTTGVDKLDIAAADGGAVTIAKFGSSTFLYYGSASTGFSALQVVGDIAVDDLIVSSAVTGVTIYGSSGTETLRGGAGSDVLVGGAGTTTLIGGGGGDALYGGSGTDIFLYTAASQSTFSAFDTIVGFNYGVDKLNISAIDGGKITLARYDGTTFVYTAPDGAGNFQTAIAVIGSQLKTSDLIISGGATQSFTIVGDGAGHNVADVLIGAGGNDILYGLDGDDILTGGGGADFILGGAGADTFVYTAVTDSSPFATDLIFDFSHAQGDKIDLSAIDANTNTTADNSFSVVTSFSHVAGQLILSTPDASGYYHLSGDVNGDGVADFVIAVNTTGTFTTADLIL